MKKITITCTSNDFLNFQEIAEFQNDVKSHNDKEIEHIIKSILQNGFSFPMFIWKHNDENHCLDGHGRLRALYELQERGYKIPLIPVVYVKADNEQEARRKLIEINNLNGDFVESVFSEFVSDLDLDLLDYNIPGLDLEKIDKKLQDVMEDVPELDIEEMKQEVKMIKIVCPECQYIFEVEA